MRHTHTTIGLQTFLAAMLALPMDPVVQHLCQGGELDLTWGKQVIWEPYRYPILGLPRFGTLTGVPVELDVALNCIRLRGQQPAASSLELQPAAHVGQWPGEATWSYVCRSARTSSISARTCCSNARICNTTSSSTTCTTCNRTTSRKTTSKNTSFQADACGLDWVEKGFPTCTRCEA